MNNPKPTEVLEREHHYIQQVVASLLLFADELEKGEHFGMIRFGSRTEVYLPLDAEILVKVGERVTGGTSVIARLR